VTGSTVNPRAEIRNGYWLVSCADPRYLTTCSRRVATSSCRWWPKAITQSDTYSSIPYRLSASLSPRSPVTIAVTSRSSSQRNSRPSSARTTASDLNAANSASIVSSMTRRAPIRLIASSSSKNSGSKSNSPTSATAAGCGRNAWMASSPSFCSWSSPKPSEATLAVTFSADSSKVTSTPGSPYSRAPATRNCSPSSVLPHPVPPVTSVDRPSGSPPPVISSSPATPVRAFGSTGPAGASNNEVIPVLPRSGTLTRVLPSDHALRHYFPGPEVPGNPPDGPGRWFTPNLANSAAAV